MFLAGVGERHMGHSTGGALVERDFGGRGLGLGREMAVWDVLVGGFRLRVAGVVEDVGAIVWYGKYGAGERRGKEEIWRVGIED